MKNVLLITIGFLFFKTSFAQVKIGKTTWASENLSITKYKDGSSIRYAKNLEDWDDAANKKEGAYFIKLVKGKKQFYYNYHAIRNKKGFLPKGFRFPIPEEFDLLVDEFINKGDVLVKKFQLSPTGIINYDSERKYHVWDEEYFGFWMSWDISGNKEEEENKEEDYYLTDNLGCGAYVNYDKNCINSTFPFYCSGEFAGKREYLKPNSNIGGGKMASLGFSVRLVLKSK